MNFIRLILALITFDSLGSSISIAQQASGKIKKYQIWVGSIMLMIVPVAYICLKMGTNPESVYIVYFIACIIAHVVRMMIIKPIIKLSLREYFHKVLFRLATVTVCSSILPIMAYKLLPVTMLSLIFVCLLCVITVAASVYLLGLEQGEREMMNGKIKSMFRKNTSKKWKKSILNYVQRMIVLDVLHVKMLVTSLRLLELKISKAFNILRYSTTYVFLVMCQRVCPVLNPIEKFQKAKYMLPGIRILRSEARVLLVECSPYLQKLFWMKVELLLGQGCLRTDM